MAMLNAGLGHADFNNVFHPPLLVKSLVMKCPMLGAPSGEWSDGSCGALSLPGTLATTPRGLSVAGARSPLNLAICSRAALQGDACRGLQDWHLPPPRTDACCEPPGPAGVLTSGHRRGGSMTMLDASAFDERCARLTAIRAGWYGDAPAVSPHGRRIYKDRTVEHLTAHNENRQPRAYLRAILRDWRT